MKTYHGKYHGVLKQVNHCIPCNSMVYFHKGYLDNLYHNFGSQDNGHPTFYFCLLLQKLLRTLYSFSNGKQAIFNLKCILSY